MTDDVVLIVPGGGVYFFWMIGFLSHVLAKFSNAVMLTASSGALAAVLACCRVDAVRATEAACRVMREHNAPNRWLGLAGVWGAALEEWLGEVLPEDAADRVRGRVRVLVNTAFPHETIAVSDFKTKRSVVKWLRAACHLPFYMDYKPYYWHQGRWCYDAGIGMREKDFCRLVGLDVSSQPYYYVDYTDDPTHDYGFNCRCVDRDFMCGLVNRGEFYARHLDGCGWFERNSRQPNTATNAASASKKTPNSS